MKIILITQNEPFYLGKNIHYLLENMPKYAKVVACVLFEVSPYGKKESILIKAKKTYAIFGLSFFLHYTLKYIRAKLFRNTQLKNVLSKHQIPILQLQKGINHTQSLDLIQSYNPDLLISIAGNQIFKKPLIELAPLGCLNLHTALLPKYRGLMPTFWVLLHNEEYTGVSVFYVDEGIDSGPILVQNKIKVNNNSLDQLIKITKKAGMDAILESINKIQKKKIDTTPNDDQQMSYFSFPKREDIKLFLKSGKKFF